MLVPLLSQQIRFTILVQEWDLEICLLLLLLAAFTAANALSLVYMGATAAGMALSANAQQARCAAHGRCTRCPLPFGWLHPSTTSCLC